MDHVSGINPSRWAKLVNNWRQVPPIRYIFTLYHLFFDRKFLVHRLTGLVYLLQFAAAVFLYCYDYQKFKNSSLMITLPIWGVLVSISAAFTFTFLPRTKLDSGYFSNNAVMSYDAIELIGIENSFFAGIVCFQCLYYNDFLFNILKSKVLVENIFVFLPYLFRTMWPKTILRRPKKSHGNKEEENTIFLDVTSLITKIFFLGGKHMFGYFLNYVRFLDRVTEEHIYHIYLLLISFCFSVTIAVFLHSLKFRGYISSKVAITLYFIYIPVAIHTVIKISEIYLTNWSITVLAALGIPLNLCSRKVQISYQVLLMAGFNAKRYGFV